MGEAGASPALSRNCSNGPTVGARIPAHTGALTTFAERGWRMRGESIEALPHVVS